MVHVNSAITSHIRGCRRLLLGDACASLFLPMPCHPEERTVALLAFNEPKASPVGDLMDIAQRQKTASELNAAILQSQCLEKESRLPMLLKILLWSQGQLDEKCSSYPKIVDLVTGQLSLPSDRKSD